MEGRDRKKEKEKRKRGREEKREKKKERKRRITNPGFRRLFEAAQQSRASLQRISEEILTESKNSRVRRDSVCVCVCVHGGQNSKNRSSSSGEISHKLEHLLSKWPLSRTTWFASHMATWLCPPSHMATKPCPPGHMTTKPWLLGYVTTKP
ncbi:hypothetical protein L345_07808, partial [Ophiophagus hannah]